MHFNLCILLHVNYASIKKGIKGNLLQKKKLA